MPRPKSQTPVLRCHISGQSMCRIAEIDYYLGRHGSPESLARYAVLIREYQANGLELPGGLTSESLKDMTEGFSIPMAKVQLSDAPILVSHLVAGYRDHVKTRYSKAHHVTDLKRRLAICDELETHDPSLMVDRFGPRKLKEYRTRFVNEGDKSRRYINRLIGEIRKMFRWGIAEELVEPNTLVGLESLSPLVGGEASYETEDVTAVSIEHVRATAKHLPPVVRDMLQVQLATGMRPSEVCSMRPCDINRKGSEWVYRPSSHKTKWKGQSREVPILGEAREVVENYLNRDPKGYCFSPAESMAWFRAKLTAERKGYGSYKKPKAVPKKEPRDCYDSHSYRQSIQRGCKEANIPNWTPYQVRHLVGTVVGESQELENAKALLGHRDIATTQIYAKATMRQSIAAARVVPKLNVT